MDLLGGYLSKMKTAKTVYDLMSILMEILVDNVPEQKQFLISFDEKQVNDQIVKNTIDKVKEIFHSFDMGGIKYQLNVLEAYFSGLPTSVKTDSDSLLTVLCATLQGINVAGTAFDLDGSNKLGPLDENEANRFRVYFNPRNPILNDYEWNMRKRAESLCLTNKFSNFIFFDSQTWKSKRGTKATAPMLLCVSNAEYSERHAGDKKLRIGICPVSSERNFEFKDSGKTRSIEYIADDEKQNQFADNVKKSLLEAMKQKCDIFLLPEYSASPRVLAAVKATIKESVKKGVKAPMLTFAGSSWTKDSNNVMTIFDSEGEEFYSDGKPVKYYKACPYRPDRRKDLSIPDVTENLKNPGKQCPIFYIPGAGIVLPSICRDLFDPEHTRVLASIFLPFLVVNAAYSPSDENFASKAKLIASEFYVSTSICNYCNARHDKTEIGQCVMVSSSSEGVPESKPSPMQKAGECTCEQGCLFVCDYDFSYIEKGTELTNDSISLNKML